MKTNHLHINTQITKVMNAQLNLFGTELMDQMVSYEPQYCWEHEGLQNFKVHCWSRIHC